MEGEGEGDSRLLHGTLEVIIDDASLPSFYTKFQRVYVTISLGRTIMAETTHEVKPAWNQTFRILCAHPAETEVVVKVRTRLWVISTTRIPASRLIGAGQSSHPTPAAEEKPLRFLLRFVPAAEEARLGMGLTVGATFPERENCGVVLYQDAHHRQTFAPPVFDSEGRRIRPRKLWEDIYAAIDGAKHLIYIAGWAFNHKIVLVRDPETNLPEAVGVELGELLKRKADEGVAVRLMLWDDASSLPLLKNPGLMRTHDEDSFAFFAGSRVVCIRVPRIHHRLPAVFTHHQKTISVDSPRRPPLASGEREIVSFVGGLDLYDGRYDTEDHSLFRGVADEDFYQVSIPKASSRHGGPREPWHDVHCQITGAAACDVLENFEQRWRKQSDPSLLLPRDVFPRFIHATGAEEDDWAVQVFRSIDGLSTAQPPENRTAERSIHEAYISAIRRAKKFIYIENQYFLGGSNLWDGDRRSGCENLVPAEIALKIAAKIRAGERFAAYVVVPMWSEGIPESATVMEILHWQRRTMAMMYKLVGEAIGDKGINAHPREYLSFFCLAKREPAPAEVEVPPPSPPRPPGQYFDAQRNRRFMIYVHSKLMIVDDEYLLMGSANVNQRSLDGGRDTEIAVGCHQPRRGSSGSVRDFRISLWYEHTGGIAEEALYRPANASCARALNEIGDKAWKAYSGGTAVEMGDIHLVSYPLAVALDGRLDDGGFFPDTKAPIKGKRHWWFPPVLTN